MAFARIFPVSFLTSITIGAASPWDMLPPEEGNALVIIRCMSCRDTRIGANGRNATFTAIKDGFEYSTSVVTWTGATPRLLESKIDYRLDLAPTEQDLGRFHVYPNALPDIEQCRGPYADRGGKVSSCFAKWV